MVPFLYCLLAVVSLSAGPVIAVFSVPPAGGELVLVITPDSTQRARIVAAADGRLVGPEEALLGSFAVSESPDFAERLKTSGAWIVVNGRHVARLCGVET